MLAKQNKLHVHTDEFADFVAVILSADVARDVGVLD